MKVKDTSSSPMVDPDQCISRGQSLAREHKQLDAIAEFSRAISFCEQVKMIDEEKYGAACFYRACAYYDLFVQNSKFDPSSSGIKKSVISRVTTVFSSKELISKCQNLLKLAHEDLDKAFGSKAKLHYHELYHTLAEIYSGSSTYQQPDKVRKCYENIIVLPNNEFTLKAYQYLFKQDNDPDWGLEALERLCKSSQNVWNKEDILRIYTRTMNSLSSDLLEDHALYHTAKILHKGLLSIDDILDRHKTFWKELNLRTEKENDYRGDILDFLSKPERISLFTLLRQIKETCPVSHSVSLITNDEGTLCVEINEVGDKRRKNHLKFVNKCISKWDKEEKLEQTKLEKKRAQLKVDHFLINSKRLFSWFIGDDKKLNPNIDAVVEFQKMQLIRK